MVDRYRIKKDNISNNEISEIVKIHREQISQGFLTSLGDKALELLFSFADVSNSGILIIGIDLEQKNKVCGFILGTGNTNKFFKDFLFSKSLQAVYYLAPRLLSIKKIRKVIEAIIYPTKSEFQDMPKSELFDLAILDKYKGKGLAQELFHEFIDVLRQANSQAVKITSGSNLHRAHSFYEKLGAQQVSTIEIHSGEDTFVYIYEIN